MTGRLIALAYRWLFAPIGGEAEYRLRIGVGLLVIWWATSWFPDAEALLGGGQLPAPRSEGLSAWSFIPSNSATGAYLALGTALFAGLALVVGRFERAATVVAFIALVSVHRAQPFALNAGDTLLKLLLLWMTVGAVLGSTSSLSHPETGPRPAVIVRLVQLQVVVMYATAGLWKLQSAKWRGGDAIYMVLTNESVAQFPWPDFVSASTTLVAALAWGTVALELLLAIGLVLKRTRRIAVVAAALMHLVFAYSLTIGIFTPAAWVALLAFGRVESTK